MYDTRRTVLGMLCYTRVYLDEDTGLAIEHTVYFDPEDPGFHCVVSGSAQFVVGYGICHAVHSGEAA